jgi:hypothetical protein
MAKAKTAARAIKTATAKKRAASAKKVAPAPVTSAKAATGKHLVAFRIIGSPGAV